MCLSVECPAVPGGGVLRPPSSTVVPPLKWAAVYRLLSIVHRKWDRSIVVLLIWDPNIVGLPIWDLNIVDPRVKWDPNIVAPLKWDPNIVGLKWEAQGGHRSTVPLKWEGEDPLKWECLIKWGEGQLRIAALPKWEDLLRSVGVLPPTVRRVLRWAVEGAAPLSSPPTRSQ